MTLTIDYNQLNTALTPQQNAQNTAKAAEIIRKNQLRSTGFTAEEIEFVTNSRMANNALNQNLLTNE